VFDGEGDVVGGDAAVEEVLNNRVGVVDRFRPGAVCPGGIFVLEVAIEFFAVGSRIPDSAIGFLAFGSVFEIVEEVAHSFLNVHYQQDGFEAAGPSAPGMVWDKLVDNRGSFKWRSDFSFLPFRLVDTQPG